MNKLSILFVILLFFSACVSTKWSGKTMTKSTLDVLNSANLNTEKIEWVSSSIKGQANLNGNNLPVTAQLRIRKDSVIWMSVSALMGIEAIRAYITPDSIQLINRLNSTYFVGNIEALSTQYNLPFTFIELQDVLLAGINQNAYTSHSLDITPDTYTLLSPNNTQSVLRLNSNYLPTEVFHSISDTQFVKINYENYMQTDSVWLPKTVKIDVQSSEKSASATINYSKQTVNRPKKLKFSIPSSYVPM